MARACVPPPCECRLLIEELGDGTFKYHLSKLPPETPIEELVRLAQQRWAIGQNYQQLEEELGLDQGSRGVVVRPNPASFVPARWHRTPGFGDQSA